MKSLVTPQNIVAEQSLIACLLMGTSVYSVPVREEHFAAPDHRLVYRAIRNLADGGKPIDIQTVYAELIANGTLEAAGGPPARFLDQANAIGQGDALVQFHFDHLETCRQTREAALYVHANLEDLTNFRLPAPKFAEELSARCAPLATREGHTASDIVREIEEDLTSGDGDEVFPTGLHPLDLHIGGGIRRGESAVVAGPPSGGKSCLMVMAAAAVAASDRPVIYISLELPRKAVLRRIAAARSGIPIFDPKKSPAIPDHEKKWRAVMCDALTWPIRILDELSNLEEICAAIRSAAKHQKTGLAIVDYLQIVRCPAPTRQLEVAETSRRLKSTAMREHIAVLTGSQVNDEGRLREARDIGFDADHVWLIGEQSMFVEKYRNGPRNISIPCELNGPLSRFEPL
jgi:replicative DNA helicase